LCLEDACVGEAIVFCELFPAICAHAGEVVIGAVIGIVVGDTISDKERRKREHAEYKDFQRKGYEKDNDPCKELKNKIEWHKELNKRRKAWDDNNPHLDWPGGRHSGDIAADSAKIERWEKELRELCGDNCSD
jgi:hypothetical protein